jgi:hypothetical protein
VRKENGNKHTLTTDKLAIIDDEDLLDRYNQQQGLQTVARDKDNNNVATPQSNE